MIQPEADTRSQARREMDELIAAEAETPHPRLPASVKPTAVEEHLKGRRSRPVAVEGVVENGMVRPLDPHVRLRERARVIIVTQE